jgi:uncharacterized membrane protein
MGESWSYIIFIIMLSLIGPFLYGETIKQFSPKDLCNIYVIFFIILFLYYYYLYKKCNNKYNDK